MELATIIFLITFCVLTIYILATLQDVRDLLDIIVSPFLYETDNPTFDKLGKQRKQKDRARAKAALKRK